ncbi:hypothetical protein BACCAP_02061 [Pseudoflavonifractor capillosus ATCC 29799]|uniref:Uncharacterized protein n=2 Tax=Pseudoflavonifractor capillosus TaxID=106588 RepID=A6NV26_9FIRM|nr:hypothetical protein BACCAP_02061 [Pseudoflavonifractor capillosus ATCC 29799]
MEKTYYVCSHMSDSSHLPKDNYEEMFTLSVFFPFPKKIKIPFVIVVEDETNDAYEFFTKTAFEMHNNDNSLPTWLFTLPNSTLKMDRSCDGVDVFHISEMQPSEVLELVNPFIKKQRYYNYAKKVIEHFFYIFRSKWVRLQEAEKRKKNANDIASSKLRDFLNRH